MKQMRTFCLLAILSLCRWRVRAGRDKAGLNPALLHPPRHRPPWAQPTPRRSQLSLRSGTAR